MNEDALTGECTHDADSLDRRRFLGLVSVLGISAAATPRLVGAQRDEVESREITEEVIAEAEKVAGLTFSKRERRLLLKRANKSLDYYRLMREVPISNEVLPTLLLRKGNPFADEPGSDEAARLGDAGGIALPNTLEEIAFWPVTDLAELIRSRQISSVALTTFYLDRLKRFDPKLQCVITLTEELAMEQARRADGELAAGIYRGPLHGIPWGAKDLLAVKNYKTTWGAETHKDQVIDEDATVVERLEKAGAVLVAKLSLGALAWGDVWFGGKTKNPWKMDEGSSGSSAGPASATAAGLVGFSIGSETWGSIVSPSSVCGVTGLRPTYGLVSRSGAMALSWSMDKLGPMCRSVEDTALVLAAISGSDPKDPTTVGSAFEWAGDSSRDGLRIGYLKSDFERDRGDDEWRSNDLESLQTLRALGFKLIPVELPDFPVEALSIILSAEAGAAFDDLTLSGRDDLLVRQEENAWPNAQRASRFIPAVEYIQALRKRTILIEDAERMMSEIDVLVVPSKVGKNLLMTNLTGQPQVVVPNGFRKNGTPTSLSFVGNWFGEADVLWLAKRYQDATGFHLNHPVLAE